MAAAATLARALRGGRRYGAGSDLMMGIGRRAPLERAADPLLPRLGAAGGAGSVARRLLYSERRLGAAGGAGGVSRRLLYSKDVRGGRNGSYGFQPLAIGRHMPQGGMLPARGSSSLDAPTAGMRRRMYSSKDSFVKSMTEKFRYVRGHFELSDSEFVVLHLNERLRRLEGYTRSARRHWLYPALTVVGGVMMVFPVALDYYRLNKIEKGIQDLRREIAEAEVECESLGIAINGL